jgi:hypothetical protein
MYFGTHCLFNDVSSSSGIKVWNGGMLVNNELDRMGKEAAVGNEDDYFL